MTKKRYKPTRCKVCGTKEGAISRRALCGRCAIERMVEAVKNARKLAPRIQRAMKEVYEHV